jgi:hypothetical protein
VNRRTRRANAKRKDASARQLSHAQLEKIVDDMHASATRALNGSGARNSSTFAGMGNSVRSSLHVLGQTRARWAGPARNLRAVTGDPEGCIVGCLNPSAAIQRVVMMVRRLGCHWQFATTMAFVVEPLARTA